MSIAVDYKCFVVFGVPVAEVVGFIGFNLSLSMHCGHAILDMK